MLVNITIKIFVIFIALVKGDPPLKTMLNTVVSNKNYNELFLWLY